MGTETLCEVCSAPFVGYANKRICGAAPCKLAKGRERQKRWYGGSKRGRKLLLSASKIFGCSERELEKRVSSARLSELLLDRALSVIQGILAAQAVSPETLVQLSEIDKKANDLKFITGAPE